MRWNERTARVLLAMVASVGDSQLHDHLGSRGATEVVEALLSQRSALRRSTTYLKRLPDDPLTAVRQAMDVSQQCRAHVVIPGDEMWPDALNDLETRCPWVMWMRGVPSPQNVKPKYSVAIVGARAATNYGTTVAYEIAADLAAEGVLVVSGGAFGIDAAAHRGALAAIRVRDPGMPHGHHLRAVDFAGAARSGLRKVGLQSWPSGESAPPCNPRQRGTAEGAGNSRTLRQKD